tara:strand:+ start:15802 stop:16218 length:417 start_codon:yes stop_codon:yes gene_type:complete
MRTLTAREAGRAVARLERVASELESNYEELNLTREAAMSFAYEIDTICDQIDKQAKLLAGDPAGIYDAFDDSPGWIEGREANPDQTYLESFNYQGGGVHPTQGSGTSVSENFPQYMDGFKRSASQSLFRGGRYVRQTR